MGAGQACAAQGTYNFCGNMGKVWAPLQHSVQHNDAPARISSPALTALAHSRSAGRAREQGLRRWWG